MVSPIKKVDPFKDVVNRNKINYLVLDVKEDFCYPDENFTVNIKMAMIKNNVQKLVILVL